jgi:hypothetical protein
VLSLLLGPVPMGHKTIALDPTFGSFTLSEPQGLLHWIQLLEVFTLSEPASHYMNWFLWWKCFRLFRLEQMFFGVQSGDTVRRWTAYYILAGPVCLWCLISFSALSGLCTPDKPHGFLLRTSVGHIFEKSGYHIGYHIWYLFNITNLSYPKWHPDHWLLRLRDLYFDLDITICEIWTWYQFFCSDPDIIRSGS